MGSRGFEERLSFWNPRKGLSNKVFEGRFASRACFSTVPEKDWQQVAVNNPEVFSATAAQSPTRDQET